MIPALGLAVSALLAMCAADVARAQSVTLGVESAELGYDMRTNEPLVTVRFTPQGAQLFAEITRNNVGRRMALRVDGRVIVAPVIREPIIGGSGQLSGGLTADQAKTMAARLSSGEAKLEVEVQTGGN
jgi:preprotein translocase subunit SecD